MYLTLLFLVPFELFEDRGERVLTTQRLHRFSASQLTTLGKGLGDELEKLEEASTKYALDNGLATCVHLDS